MKRGPAIILIIVLSIIAFVLYQRPENGIDSNDTNDREDVSNNQGDVSTYKDVDSGLTFKYKTGANGYVVDERMPVDIDPDLVKNIILTRTEDASNEPPVGGEGAPVITVSIYNNNKKQFPRNWADENIQYSNINLLQGEVAEEVVGGANAIGYTADGLYASDNFVVANGSHIFVFNGQYMDANAQIRKDFADLIASVEFVRAPGQE